MYLYRSTRIACIGVCAAFLTGCSISLASVSAGQIGCRPHEITIEDDTSGLGTRTWTAKCRGKTFSCSAYTTGEKDAEAHCTEMVPESGGPQQPGAGAPPGISGGGASPEKNFVVRAYDEEKGQQMVRGSFYLAEQLHLRLIGNPQELPGRVNVFLTGQTRDQYLYSCGEMVLFVNAKPERASENSVLTKGQDIYIGNLHEVAALEPLTQQYSSFEVQACHAKWTFSEEQIDELKKFLVIYSQLVEQVQSEDTRSPDEGR
jgi:hypothetical protein